MNAESIQSLCIAGTEAYLDFLVKNNLGLQPIRVIRKEQIGEQEKRLFKLTLAARMFDPDGITLQLVPPNKTYGPAHFQVVEYDADAKVFIIQVQTPELSLENGPAENLQVISDLKFLVRNVKRWFEENGRWLELPQEISPGHSMEMTAESLDSGVSLDESQSAVVSASLASPLAYIWGPPGTGKTKHVLTNAVLRLLRDNKRVGIFAPTNNALEQAMAAIINAGASEGLDRDKFLRVGSPSAKFAKEFPEVCEIQGLKRRLVEIRRQIKVYSDVLHYRSGATVLNSAATLRNDISELRVGLKKRRTKYEKRAQLDTNFLSRVIHRGELRALDEELTKLEAVINGQLEMIKRTQTESPKLNAMIERIDFTNVEQIDEGVASLEDATREFMDVRRAYAEEYHGQTTEAIQRLRSDQQEQLRDLEAKTVAERIKIAWATGMTLDCFIGRFHDTILPFDHIFLDEAGYAPLVKALALCRGGVPLSLLGDHKQLGPVCEMNDDNLGVPENNPAIVWRKSALFLNEPFLADDHNTLIDRLFEKKEPKLLGFTRADLNITYRFGQNLSDILSACVYHFPLVSSGQRDLEIICLDAVPDREPSRKRENQAEIKAIGKYLREHPELDDDAEGTFAILAPYTNQVALLGDILVQQRRQNRIMTVHKSQGREWDTVFLSVVDGRFNRPWFTDTENPKSGGLYVMNTAISRARKRLILVCNANFWLKPDAEDQLLSRLVKVSDRVDREAR